MTVTLNNAPVEIVVAILECSETLEDLSRVSRCCKRIHNIFEERRVDLLRRTINRVFDVHSFRDIRLRGSNIIMSGEDASCPTGEIWCVRQALLRLQQACILRPSDGLVLADTIWDRFYEFASPPHFSPGMQWGKELLKYALMVQAYDEALFVAERAYTRILKYYASLSASYTEDYIIVSLAQLYRRQGKDERALEILHQALRVDPLVSNNFRIANEAITTARKIDTDTARIQPSSDSASLSRTQPNLLGLLRDLSSREYNFTFGKHDIHPWHLRCTFRILSFDFVFWHQRLLHTLHELDNRFGKIPNSTHLTEAISVQTAILEVRLQHDQEGPSPASVGSARSLAKLHQQAGQPAEVLRIRRQMLSRLSRYAPDRAQQTAGAKNSDSLKIYLAWARETIHDYIYHNDAVTALKLQEVVCEQIARGIEILGTNNDVRAQQVRLRELMVHLTRWSRDYSSNLEQAGRVLEAQEVKKQCHEKVRAYDVDEETKHRMLMASWGIEAGDSLHKV